MALTICPDERYLDITLALKLAQKAVTLNPEANFLDTLAAVYAEVGKLEDARNAALELKKRKFRDANVVKKPYAIQVGASGSDQELRKLEADLASEGYLAYTIPDTQGTSKTRLLIGAFRRAKEASILMKKLQEEGFKPKVVLR